MTIILAALVGTAPAAQAAGYVPSTNITVSGDATPGGTVTVDFAATSFEPNEQVSISVTGNTTVTLAAVRAAATVSLTKQASATGALSVTVTLPADANGTYTLTATGLSSGNIGTASIATLPAAAGVGSGSTALAETGATLPMFMIWAGGGALILGAAIVGTLAYLRRQNAKA
ncbi:hypothetical protein [Sinomonas cyclohexanicum]|nr:hypothetical protein [Corynebacterium cyclohexanicum]